jgi:hypothetical protein
MQKGNGMNISKLRSYVCAIKSHCTLKHQQTCLKAALLNKYHNFISFLIRQQKRLEIARQNAATYK